MANPSEDEPTLTVRVLRELADRGPGACVLARDVAQALDEYAPHDPETGAPADGDVHPVRQVLNRLSRASFADELGYGPVERYDKRGPFTVYRVTAAVDRYLRERS